MSRTPRAKWIAAIRKHNGRCFFCGQEATTVDHARPRSRNGKNEEDNLLPACLRCNNIKNDLTVEEFREYIKARILRDLFIMGYASRNLEALAIVFYGESNDSPLSY